LPGVGALKAKLLFDIIPGDYLIFAGFVKKSTMCLFYSCIYYINCYHRSSKGGVVIPIETIRQLILDSQRSDLRSFTPRDLPIQFVQDMSLSIVGSHRSGKTYRTFQLISDLLAQGLQREQVCRIQFNDLRLREATVADLSAIEQTYYALYPEKSGRETVYFIFDEIHMIEGWETFILGLLEQSNHRVCITGSTSRLLKGEIASSLRGKNYPVVLYPFSFAEFIRHYKVAPDTDTSRGQALLRNMISTFLTQGGYPGLLDAPKNIHFELLQTYWTTMVMRDIIEAHPRDRIAIETFQRFAQSIISRTACPLTVRKIGAELTDAGIGFSTPTLYKFLYYLEEAFMVFPVPFYSRSEKIKNRNYMKIYAVDWALADAVSTSGPVGITRRLENAVFMELLRRGNTVSYYRTEKEGYEIDFVAHSKHNPHAPPDLIQVCYDLGNAETRTREMRAITASAGFLGAQSATIVTLDSEETADTGGVRIRVVPGWKWLLEH
jgi:uncharacterized protein